MSAEVTELRNVIQLLAQKINDDLEQDLRGEMTATAELLNKRYDRLSEHINLQQRQINEMAKLLGWKTHS